MKLILFTGLPGTGKSTLAEIVSQKLCIPIFAKDTIDTLSGLPTTKGALEGA